MVSSTISARRAWSDAGSGPARLTPAPAARFVGCSAGQGQWDGSVIPHEWSSRTSRPSRRRFAKAQDRTVGSRFAQCEAGTVSGFALSYLGMRDESLRRNTSIGPLPSDVVTRDQAISYPTNFRGGRGLRPHRSTRRATHTPSGQSATGQCGKEANSMTNTSNGIQKPSLHIDLTTRIGHSPMPSEALSSKSRPSRTYSASIAADLCRVCFWMARSGLPARAAVVANPALSECPA